MNKNKLLILAACTVTLFALTFLCIDVYANGENYIPLLRCLDKLHIIRLPDEIIINNNYVDIKLTEGETQYQLVAAVIPDNSHYKNLIWSSNNAEIADVDDSGMVTAKKAGTAKITVSTIDKSLSTDCRIKVRQGVRGISLNQSLLRMNADSKPHDVISARIEPQNATNQNIKWESNDTSIASVDEKGIITPHTGGMAFISVTTEDGDFIAECRLLVAGETAEQSNSQQQNTNILEVDNIIYIANKPKTLNLGDKYTLIVKKKNADTENVNITWSSGNTYVAAIDKNGQLTAKGYGKAKISAKTPDGMTDEFILTVSANSLHSNYHTTLERMISLQLQSGGTNKIYRNGGLVAASKMEIASYLNPANYIDGYSKYQFLRLDSPNNISENVMAVYLKDKGILSGHQKAFIDAANKYNISEVYLAAHACLETGNGTSTLAKGVMYNNVKVYNMYGIGAYDSDPVLNGSKRAYENGWTTPEKAIIGGAKIISSQYINSSKYTQNTLYKMLWNPSNPGKHQYATDIGWAVKQSQTIGKVFAQFPAAKTSYDVPVYGDMTKANF